MKTLWTVISRVTRRAVCLKLGCKPKPYVSSVGWMGVTLCARCKFFNPMDEWREG